MIGRLTELITGKIKKPPLAGEDISWQTSEGHCSYLGAAPLEELDSCVEKPTALRPLLARGSPRHAHRWLWPLRECLALPLELSACAAHRTPTRWTPRWRSSELPAGA